MPLLWATYSSIIFPYLPSTCQGRHGIGYQINNPVGGDRDRKGHNICRKQHGISQRVQRFRVTSPFTVHVDPSDLSFLSLFYLKHICSFDPIFPCFSLFLKRITVVGGPDHEGCFFVHMPVKKFTDRTQTHYIMTFRQNLYLYLIQIWYSSLVKDFLESVSQLNLKVLGPFKKQLSTV